jgi:hypothetical protein
MKQNILLAVFILCILTLLALGEVFLKDYHTSNIILCSIIGYHYKDIKNWLFN